MIPALAAIKDAGSRIDDPTFWAFIALVVGLAFGTWLGYGFRHAILDRLNSENHDLRERLAAAPTEKTCELCGKEEALTCPRCTVILRAALLDQPYDQDRQDGDAS